MKSPHNQRPDHLAREKTEEFIREHARTPLKVAPDVAAEPASA
jgi:hypothetical protein